MTFGLTVFDFNNHKEFHQSYIADEYILEDIMVDRRRKSGLEVRMSVVKKNGFKLVVDDEIMFRGDLETGESKRYFVVIIRDIEDNEISRVEKTYEDFQSFEKSLTYLLREGNATVPRLDQSRDTTFGMINQSSVDMFG